MQLDLEVAANKKLNKLGWCYLTLMLEGDALDEMDMIPDQNAYAIWLCLNRKYKPSNGKASEESEMKSEKEREECTACKQKRQIKPTEEECYERQEEKGYCYIDLWNEDFEAVKEEDEAEDFYGKMKREKENMPMMEENEEDPIKEENQEDENAEEFPVKKEDDDSVENNNGKDAEVSLDHDAKELEENETDEAVNNEEEFSFLEEESKEKEEWEEQEEECTIGKGKATMKMRQVWKKREKQIKMSEKKKNT